VSESSDGSESEDKKPPPKNKPPPKKRAPAKRRPKKKAKKDKNAPKKPTTAYMFYASEKRTEFQEKYKGITFGELSKKIAAEWKTLDNDQKKPYADKHAEDKKRYDKQMEDYVPPEKSSSESDSDSDDSSDDKKKKKTESSQEEKRS